MGNKLVLLFFFFCVNSVHWTQVLWAPRESNISGAFWGLFSSLVMLFQTIVNSSHSSKKFGICSLYPIWSPDRLRSSILLSFLELFEICFPPSTFQQLSIVNYIVSKSLVFVVCTQSDLQTDCALLFSSPFWSFLRSVFLRQPFNNCQLSIILFQKVWYL